MGLSRTSFRDEYDGWSRRADRDWIASWKGKTGKVNASPAFVDLAEALTIPARSAWRTRVEYETRSPAEKRDLSPKNSVLSWWTRYTKQILSSDYRCRA